MALKSTICKAELAVADIERGYYGNHAVTLARHPSETDERMMVRLLAFALHADDALAFGRGLSADGEPDLWQRDLTGTIEQWIDVGLPDEREVRKACGRAREVHVLAYGGRAVDLWWQRIPCETRATGSARSARGADRCEPGAGANGRSLDAAANNDPGRQCPHCGRRNLHSDGTADSQASVDGALTHAQKPEPRLKQLDRAAAWRVSPSPHARARA
jgi:uncharacterized protein YaeQ